MRSIFAFFDRLGAAGLFLLGIGDGSYFFMPFGIDLLLIGLVSSETSQWYWLVHVFSAAAGSTIGALLVDLVMRPVGSEGLEHFVDKRRIERMEKKLEENAWKYLFVGTLVPPPFPTTAVIAVASALQVPRWTLVNSVFLGRCVRFTAVALLALYLGRRLVDLMSSDYVAYLVYAFIAVAVVGTIYSLWRLLKCRRGYRKQSRSLSGAD